MEKPIFKIVIYLTIEQKVHFIFNLSHITHIDYISQNVLLPGFNPVYSNPIAQDDQFM